MKSDLDALMDERGLDAAVIEGPDGTHGANPAFAYFTGSRSLVGTVIAKRGEAPQLIYRAMERDVAESTGLALVETDRWPVHEIIEQERDRLSARVELYRRIFEDLGVQGRVAFYGTGAIGAHHALLNRLVQQIPDIEIVDEYDHDLIATARETKETDEIRAIERVGQQASQLMDAVIAHMKAHRVENGTLTKDDGAALTVADVRRFIRRDLAQRGLEAPLGTIFATGRSAGIPHSVGPPEDPIELGKTIVFDLFPRDASGYFHDMTRTFCLGYAPPEVEQAYRDVIECFDTVAGELQLGERTQRFQHRTCELFRERGHPTILTDPKTRQGYVHSLGHGVGLEVHEEPYFPTFGASETRLREGMVFTVEPGLYYPERELGMRVEDTYVCEGRGEFRSLTRFPKDLVIPMDA